MLRHHLTTVGADGFQTQRMHKNGGLLRGLEAGKAQLVRHLKSTRQDQAQGLAEQLIFSPAVGLLESLVNRNHL